MSNLKRFSIAFCLLSLSLIFAGCSKDDPDLKSERKISKISELYIERILVEDVASGQVIEDTEIMAPSERTYTWDGEFLKKYTYTFNDILYTSFIYSYADGVLDEVVDETDGGVYHFSYSDGHLDKMTFSTDSDVLEVYQYYYDGQGRVKSRSFTCSDGSDIFGPGMFPGVDTGVFKQLEEYEYSDNNILVIRDNYFASTAPEKSVRESVGVFRYSSVINPLKGLYTDYFMNHPEWASSENIVEREQVFVNGMLSHETNSEITSDNGYPVQIVCSKINTGVADGKRTTVEYTNVADYEYLD